MTNSNTDGNSSQEAVEEIEPLMVILDFESDHLGDLLDVLARYVVATRGEPGCRNIDLVVSSTREGRVVVVEKWDSVETQQAHFDSANMVAMATATVPLLRRSPDIDLFDGVSMHDLA